MTQQTLQHFLADVARRLEAAEEKIDLLLLRLPAPVSMLEPEIRTGVKIKGKENGWAYEIADVYVQGDVTVCKIRHTASPSGGHVSMVYSADAIRRNFDFV